MKSCQTILHIGANTGQEREVYNRLGLEVLWIEAIPKIYEELVDNLSPYLRQFAFQALLSEEDGQVVTFNVANNGGLSSSMLDFSLHKDIWPDVDYDEKLTLETMRLDTVVKAAGWENRQIDALLLDVQGAEMLVLKGAGRILDSVKFVLAEAADFEIYKNGTNANELESYLLPYGFYVMRYFEFAKHPNGGKCFDILFARKSKFSGNLQI